MQLTGQANENYDPELPYIVSKISPKKVFTAKILKKLGNEMWRILLVSLISFGANDFGCGVGQPLVPPLHHRVDFLRFAEITQLNAREVSAEDQNVVKLHVSMTNFSVRRQRNWR